MASFPSSSSMGQVPSRLHDERVEWLIATMKKGVPTIYNVEMSSRITGATAMHTIGKAYRETTPSVPWYHSRLHLEDAVICSFAINADPEAQDYPRSVIIKSSKPLLELTKAFHNPALVNGSGQTLILDYQQFNVAASRNSADSEYHAILITTEASHWLIAIGIAGAIAVSATIGYVTGYSTGNAQLGVTAGAAAVAVFTLVQGCMVFLKWLY